MEFVRQNKCQPYAFEIALSLSSTIICHRLWQNVQSFSIAFCVDANAAVVWMTPIHIQYLTTRYIVTKIVMYVCCIAWKSNTNCKQKNFCSDTHIFWYLSFVEFNSVAVVCYLFLSIVSTLNNKNLTKSVKKNNTKSIDTTNNQDDGGNAINTVLHRSLIDWHGICRVQSWSLHVSISTLNSLE